MNAKQYWESAQRTCVTLGDMVVDPQTAALLRRVQALLRGPVQAKTAKEAYDLASLARDALTQGDKEDAKALLDRLHSMLDTAPAVGNKALLDRLHSMLDTAPAVGNKTADPAKTPGTEKQTKSAAEKKAAQEQNQSASETINPRKSVTRRMLMPIFNKLRSALGGEKGKQAAQRALYTEEHENKEREIAEIEGKLDALLKERDELRMKLGDIVQKARGLDKSSFEYTRMRHDATLLKPKLDAIDGSISTLMKRTEDLAKISASYQSVLLSMQNTIDEHAMVRTSVLVDQAAEQIDLAADQDRELHKMASKTAEVHQRILNQAQEDEPNFFDELVSGTDKTDEEDDPFDQMVAEANKKAEAETSANDTVMPEKPAGITEDPLEL